jgi:hypothetical protein
MIEEITTSPKTTTAIGSLCKRLSLALIDRLLQICPCEKHRTAQIHIPASLRSQFGSMNSLTSLGQAQILVNGTNIPYVLTLNVPVYDDLGAIACKTVRRGAILKSLARRNSKLGPVHPLGQKPLRIANLQDSARSGGSEKILFVGTSLMEIS